MVTVKVLQDVTVIPFHKELLNAIMKKINHLKIVSM